MQISLTLQRISNVADFKRHSDWLLGAGAYLWCVQSDTQLMPYYIGETQNFRVRLQQEFKEFLSGGWFCFDPESPGSFHSIVKQISGRHVQDLAVEKNGSFLMCGTGSRHLFEDYLDPRRIRVATKMIEATSWVFLSFDASDTATHKMIRKELENRLILNYRRLLSVNGVVPTLTGNSRRGAKTKTSSKQFVGDWNHREVRPQAAHIQFKLMSSELLNHAEMKFVETLLKSLG